MPSLSLQTAASPRAQIDSHLKVGLVLLALYLAARFELTVVDTLQAWGIIEGHGQWVLDALTYGSLVCAMGLIVWERKRLAQFHIDGLAVAFIVFGAINHKAVGLGLAALFLLALLVLAVKPGGPAQKAGVWLAVGLAAGFALGGVSGLGLRAAAPPLGPPASVSALISCFVAQLSRAATYEEPLFRGFLWGYLRLLGWKDGAILWFQTGLFMLGHLYYLPSHLFSLLFIVPLGGIIFGLLAWRSRSIAPSMLAHAAANSFGDLVAHFQW